MKSTVLNVLAGALIGLTGGCLLKSTAGDRVSMTSASGLLRVEAAPRLAAGTTVAVRLSDKISSETAKGGDAWRGVTTRDVQVIDGGVIPQGSAVDGIVSDARSERADRPVLELRLISISGRGRLATVRASMNPMTLAAASPQDPIVFREGSVMTFRIQ